MLHLENVSVEISGEEGHAITLVRRVGFSVSQGGITAIVGESGSGKTLTAMAIMGLLPSREMRVTAGSRIVFEGENISELSPKSMACLRGKELSMVFQDPGASLNPVLTIGRQLAEPLVRHLGFTRRQALGRAVELLKEVGIPSPEQRVKSYPHELSGGQQQRVMIAMAIACQPKLLIADEPTSALDVTVQRQIIELIMEIRRTHGLSVIFISHDLGVVAEIADRVVVMRKGEVVEEGMTKNVLFAPSHPYTQSLVQARGRLARRPHVDKSDGGALVGKLNQPGLAPELLDTDVRLEVRKLRKDYSLREGLGSRKTLHAVKDVSLDLYRGETLGIVGESGSGKTTLAMMLVRLIDVSGGNITLDGQRIDGLSGHDFRPMRRKIQVVFQNPYASLNPRWTIRQTLINPMKLHGLGVNEREWEQRAMHFLDKVGLAPAALEKFPQQFSGGERQRIAIARCMCVEPDILICDECVSALDVSTQLQILDLLRDLKNEYGVSYLFIAHDLATVRYIADRVLVFQDGQIVEASSVESLFRSPQHPYTQQLLASIPHWPGQAV